MAFVELYSITGWKSLSQAREEGICFVGSNPLHSLVWVCFNCCCSHSARNEFCNCSFELMEDSESQSYVKHDSGQSWSNSHVETHETLSSVNGCKAVSKSFVLVRVNSLHLCLYHIYRVVKHRGAEASNSSWSEINYHFVWYVLRKYFLGIFEHQESHSLIGRLF